MSTMPTRASAAYRPFSIRCRSFRRPLQGFSSADDADQQHDDGDHQKDVDEAAYGICGNHTEKPKTNKDDGDRIKHDEPPDGEAARLPPDITIPKQKRENARPADRRTLRHLTERLRHDRCGNEQ